MRLTGTEEAMLAGELGEARRWALEQQLAVGQFFDAEDFVPVTRVHICADTEAMGESGVQLLERFAGLPPEEKRVAVPTLSDPRGADFKRYARIRQPKAIVELERRAADAMAALGILMVDSCIVYQVVEAPIRGEHLAYGDTGSVIYANSVLGAFSNYEGGPAALAAALTGRTPRYGYHLPTRRRGTRLFRLTEAPRCLADWGAIGGIIGRRMQSYWDVPVIEPAAPLQLSSDSLKHLGTALASYGSTALFHLVGVTPEAPDLDAAFAADRPAATAIGRREIDGFFNSFEPSRQELDVVVFSAPQLSLLEIESLAALLEGRIVNASTALVVATSPEVKHASDRLGLTQIIERAGGVVLEGVCFYQMHARELARENGWRTLMTNSAKLVNIVGGYGYEPILAPASRCVESAVAGKVLK